uniref:Uncharacterized protein n=1 Tax=Trichogramma kaykai TaxID=54128 RepID=A0ABD2XCM9_9HYME
MEISIAGFQGPENLEKLKSTQKNVNWEIVDERRKFIRRVSFLIVIWYYGRFPRSNLQDVFRSEDIEHLAMDYINFVDKDTEYIRKLELFIKFLAYSGYKDEPKLDSDGKPSSRRTTPVHIMAKRYRDKVIDITHQLFEIYNRYDVNYTDESGLSHFHVACIYGYDDDIREFLEFGQDPNCLWAKTGDSPLHLYLIGKNKCMRNTKMAEVLMRNSSDLNLANKDGLTPLHLISKKYNSDMSRNLPFPDVAKLLFEIAEEKQQLLQVDARDNFGNTPFHLAVLHYNDYVMKMLLTRGADPNAANDEGSTPLHILYKRHSDDFKNSVALFFKVCDELNHLIQVDAKDKLGHTPLQLAVANLWPNCIDILFERGADLSNFIFPTESYFAERYNKSSNKITGYCRLRLASGALFVVEKIENRGYQLKRSNALTIMKFFAKYRLFEKSSDLEKCWFNDEKFITKAKEIRTRLSLSLEEVVRLRPEEAAKLLTYEDYWQPLSYSIMYLHTGEKEYEELTSLHLCEKLSRGFFRSWALDPLWELIHKRLPLECCDMITEVLKNEDLYNICLAAAGQTS